MTQFTSKHTPLWISIALLCMGLFVQSCNDEDNIQGCTDPESTNYDPLATEDDGSCTYNAERFYGIYLGELDCEDNQLIQLSNDSTTLEISQGVYSTRDSVTLTISAGPDFPPLSVAGSISGDILNVNETLDSIPIPIEGVFIFLDISTNASVELKNDNQLLEGPLTLSADFSENGIEFLSSDCNYSGDKQ